MTCTEVKVGIADLNLVVPPNKIMTIGLGSCIGISIYDRITKVAGLAHIMLPDSKQFHNISNPLKFADLAVPILVEKMVQKGSNKKNLIAKIAGGASMFSFGDNNLSTDIGKRNAEAVKVALKKENIPILAEDIGGKKGRTMIIEPENGNVLIKTIGEGQRIL